MIRCNRVTANVRIGRWEHHRDDVALTIWSVTKRDRFCCEAARSCCAIRFACVSRCSSAPQRAGQQPRGERIALAVEKSGRSLNRPVRRAGSAVQRGEWGTKIGTARNPTVARLHRETPDNVACETRLIDPSNWSGCTEVESVHADRNGWTAWHRFGRIASSRLR